MIRALGHEAGGKPVVILGLEPQNMSLLREGQPIRVNLHHLNPDGQVTDLPDIDVVIMFAGRAEIEALQKAHDRDRR